MPKILDSAKRTLVKFQFLDRLYFFVKRSPIYNFFRFSKWTNKYIPEVIYLESTNLCNANCIMCPHNKMKRKKGNMPWGVFKKIVDDCKDFEGRGLFFSLNKDGEPLMDPLLFKKIKYIKKILKKSVVDFNTNAMLLNEKKAREILNSSLDYLTFSVDAAKKKTYEKIRCGLKYETVVKNINNFFKLKEKMGKKKPYVTMQMVVSENNKNEVEKYKSIWKGKADKVYFKAMHNFLIKGTSIKTKKITKKQLRRCYQPFTLLAVFWNGDVALCCWDYDNLVKLGNVMNDHVLEIFNNEKFRKIREMMIKKDCGNFYPCSKCSQIYGFDADMDY